MTWPVSPSRVLNALRDMDRPRTLAKIHAEFPITQANAVRASLRYLEAHEEIRQLDAFETVTFALTPYAAEFRRHRDSHFGGAG